MKVKEKPRARNTPRVQPTQERNRHHGGEHDNNNSSGAAWKASLLEAALAYAAAGLPVFPCNAEKAPRVKLGFRAATVEIKTIRRWWNKWPNALIGIPTGLASTFDVLDLDVKNGKDGRAAVPDWETRSPVSVDTPSGGAHLYFQSDGYVEGWKPSCERSNLPKNDH